MSSMRADQVTTRLWSHERERISTEKKAIRGEYIRKFQFATQTLAGLQGLSMEERSCIFVCSLLELPLVAQLDDNYGSNYDVYRTRRQVGKEAATSMGTHWRRVEMPNDHS